MTTVLTTVQYADCYGYDELEALTDRDGSHSPDPNFFERWAREATAIIEEYLGTQPDPLPDGLLGIAAALTRWHLYQHEKPEAVQAGYDSAIRRLNTMRQGLLERPSTVLSESLPNFNGRERVLW